MIKPCYYRNTFFSASEIAAETLDHFNMALLLHKKKCRHAVHALRLSKVSPMAYTDLSTIGWSDLLGWLSRVQGENIVMSKQIHDGGAKFQSTSSKKVPERDVHLHHFWRVSLGNRKQASKEARLSPEDLLEPEWMIYEVVKRFLLEEHIMSIESASLRVQVCTFLMVFFLERWRTGQACIVTDH